MNRAERRRQEKAKSKQAKKISTAIGAPSESVKHLIDDVMDDVYKRTESRIQEAIDSIEEVAFKKMRMHGIGVDRANRIVKAIIDELFEAKIKI